MKSLIYTFAVVASLLFATSCSDTEGVSRITTYATLAIEGQSVMFWTVGEPWQDPGYSAFEGETDITDKVQIKGSVDVDEPGTYNISYMAQNSDGYWASIARTVYVCETSAPLTGFYDSSITRTYNGASAKRGPYTIVVMGLGGDVYQVEDLLGGWYKIGSGYGAAYGSVGVIEIKADNSIELLDSEPLAWGYPCSFYDASSYDPATGTISMKVIMDDTPTMLFDVTLSNKH